MFPQNCAGTKSFERRDMFPCVLPNPSHLCNSFQYFFGINSSRSSTMMLSPSAARLGTSIRLKGKSIPFRPFSIGGNRRWLHDGKTTNTITSAVTIPTNTTSRIRHSVPISDITHQLRNKSTASAISYDIEEGNHTTTPSTTTNTLGLSYTGHAAAAEYRAKHQQQQQQVNSTIGTTTVSAATTATAIATTLASESWRINVGRGNDNAWLMGPRNDQEWFTGIAPNENCPGTFGDVCICE